MRSVSSLGYTVIQTPDLPAWDHYAKKVLGLMPGRGPVADALYYRMDDHPFRIVVMKGEKNKFLCAGWETSSQKHLDVLIASLKKNGHKVTEEPDALVKERFVQRLVSVVDPAGNRVELYWGRHLDYRPFISPVGVSHFITDDGMGSDMGLGHIVLPASGTAKETVAFYHEALGFGYSDELTIQEGLDITFLHCDNPRHHSLAVATMPSNESGLVHMMLEVPTVDDVGKGLDRCAKHDIHITVTMGRHTNDHMLSFYMRSPADFWVELGAEGRMLDWETFVPTVSKRSDYWGHRFMGM